MSSARVSIRSDDFDLGAEVAALRQGDGGVGAVATFIGTVRDRNDGAEVQSLELEHCGFERRIDDECLGLRLERSWCIIQSLFGDLGDLRVQLDTPLRLVRVASEDLGDLDQTIPVAQNQVDRLEYSGSRSAQFRVDEPTLECSACALVSRR